MNAEISLSPRENFIQVSLASPLDGVRHDFLITPDGRKRKSLLRQVAVLALISLAFVTRVLAGPTYPLMRSANGRYLVDQSNTPFLMIGDTAWSLMVNISEADAAVY